MPTKLEQPGGRLSHAPAAAGPTAVRRQATIAWTWIAAVCLTWLNWSTASLAPITGYDPSWLAALHLAAHRGMSFGDIVYAYGPLGFLSLPVLYYSSTAALSLLYIAVVEVALALALLRSTRRSFPAWLAVLISYFVLTLPRQESDVLLLVLFLWCVRLAENRSSANVRGWVVPAGGALCAVELLVKLNMGVVSLALVAVVAWHLRPFRWRAEGLLGASFLLSLLILWGISRNSFTELPRWAYASFQLSIGYSSLALERPGREWEYFAAAALIAVLALLLWHRSSGEDRARRISLFAVFAIFFFGYFKEGFVRHDAGHSLLFFGACATACVAFAWGPRLRWAALSALVATAIVSGAAIDSSRPLVFLDPVDVVRAATDSARAASGDLRTMLSSAGQRAVIDNARTSMQRVLGVDPEMLNEIGGRTVDVDPYETSAIWAYGLRWRPIMTIQASLGYTRYLDDQNAKRLASAGAPERILRQDSPLRLDGKTPPLESPAYFLAMLCHYEELSSDPRWELLGRTGERCGEPRSNGSVEADAGQIVTVPASATPDSIVFARIHLPHSLFSLRALLYKPATIPSIRLDGAGPYRLISGTAADPLVLRVPPPAGFSAGYDGALDVSTLELEGVDGPFRVDFFRVAIEPTYTLRRLRVLPGTVGGRVDRSAKEGPDVRLEGWAASVSTGRPADRILVFSHGRLLFVGQPSIPRPDVASFFKNAALVESGFDIRVPSRLITARGARPDLRVFGEVAGRATELGYPPHYAWRR